MRNTLLPALIAFCVTAGDAQDGRPWPSPSRGS